MDGCECALLLFWVEFRKKWVAGRLLVNELDEVLYKDDMLFSVGRSICCPALVASLRLDAFANMADVRSIALCYGVAGSKPSLICFVVRLFFLVRVDGLKVVSTR